MRLVTEYITANRDDLAINSDVREFLDEKFPPHHPNAWAKDFLYGLDQSALLAMSTKVNMVLHRDGNTHVYHADGLAPLAKYTDPRLKGSPHDDAGSYSRAVAESFDLVVSNPPFSITLPPDTSDALSESFELAGDRNSENLFLERWYQLLKPGGRLAVVLPESTFSTKENFAARSFLLDHFDVKAIVSLPKHAFEPWTPTRTCLLFATKKTRDAESEWRKERDAAALATRTAKSLAQRLTRKLAKAARRLGEDGGDLNAGESDTFERLNGALSELGLPTLSVPEVEEETIQSTLGELKAINPELIGLQSAAEKHGSEYTAVTVASIGYKRTKRTEYNRPNELFRATISRELPEGGTVEGRVLNLNLGPRDWRIVTDDEGAPTDLLSILASRRIWN